MDEQQSKSDRKCRRQAKRIHRLFDDIKEGAILQVERRISKKPKLLSATDKKGRSPLHIAAVSGTYQMCSLLLRRSADVNRSDDAGNTALHSAAKEERWAIAELLIAKGALRDIKNNKGKTAASYGLDEALAEIHMEDERLAQKQEWISEERSRFERETAKSFDREREWREKLFDEHNFEHLEGGHGSGYQGPRDRAWIDGWFADEEEALDDDDWWEAIARQMRRRHRAFSHRDEMGAGSCHKAEPSPDRPAYHGIGEDARMAWERKWAKEGQPPSTAIGAGPGPGYEQRAAAHALAWERFIATHAGAGGAEAAGPIRFEDVPWPAAAAGGDLAEEAIMLPAALRRDPDARRRAVREALRRWHPDKFGQRFAGRLAAADRERILERVKAVAQALTALVQ